MKSILMLLLVLPTFSEASVFSCKGLKNEKNGFELDFHFLLDDASIGVVKFEEYELSLGKLTSIEKFSMPLENRVFTQYLKSPLLSGLTLETTKFVSTVVVNHFFHKEDETSEAMDASLIQYFDKNEKILSATFSLDESITACLPNP